MAEEQPAEAPTEEAPPGDAPPAEEAAPAEGGTDAAPEEAGEGAPSEAAAAEEGGEGDAGGGGGGGEEAPAPTGEEAPPEGEGTEQAPEEKETDALSMLATVVDTVGEEAGEEAGEEEVQEVIPVTKKQSTHIEDLRLSLDTSDTKVARMSTISMDKRQRLSTKQKVIGSIISVRKSFFDGAGGGPRTAKYMNSYKLDSDKAFHVEKVEKILVEVMTEALENLTYEVDHCIQQAKWASSTIRAKVKEQEYDRYKIVVIVTIGEKRSQDVFSSMKFLWDPERDKYSTISIDNMHVFAYACCIGFYYE